MIGTAILCSGQGGQNATMFTLLADAPEAAPVFAAAKGLLRGIDPRDLAHQATSETIHTDKIAQILCCTQAMAAWAVIGGQLQRPLVVAGYSVGELAAWGVAGLVDAAGVLALAADRAAAMDVATTQPSGLAAVRGLTRVALEAICQAHGGAIAIVNAADQMLVGGTNASLAAIVRDAVSNGATHAALLPVAVASHTPLLGAASAAFRKCLAAVSIRSGLPSGIRLLTGIDGMAVFDVPEAEAKLAQQIQHTVDWAACMESCHSLGVTKVIELGPGSALVRMMRDVIPDADCHGLSEFHSLDGFIRWVMR